VVGERFRARFHERERPHVVVVAHEESTERVHERIIAVPAVARPEQVLHEGLEFLVSQPAVQKREELLFLPRPDVEQGVVRSRLLESWVVLLVVRGARVVEDDDRNRMSVAPEVLVVLLHGLADVAQSIGGNNEIQVAVLHWSLSVAGKGRGFVLSAGADCGLCRREPLQGALDAGAAVGAGVAVGVGAIWGWPSRESISRLSPRTLTRLSP